MKCKLFTKILGFKIRTLSLIEVYSHPLTKLKKLGTIREEMDSPRRLKLSKNPTFIKQKMKVEKVFQIYKKNMHRNETQIYSRNSDQGYANSEKKGKNPFKFTIILSKFLSKFVSKKINHYRN